VKTHHFQGVAVKVAVRKSQDFLVHPVLHTEMQGELLRRRISEESLEHGLAVAQRFRLRRQNRR